jgi:hypothetical protein
VVFKINGTEIGTRPVAGGSASMTIGPAPAVGTVQVTATYSGDATSGPSTSAPKTLTVVKADVDLDLTIKPKPVFVDKTKTKVKIEVSAPGQEVTGEVRVKWDGNTETVTLNNGKATVQLGKWDSTGEKVVRVRYLGSSIANPAGEAVTFTVRP